MRITKQKTKSIDGHNFKHGETTYYLKFEATEVAKGIFGEYTCVDNLFYNKDIAELFVKGKIAIEDYVNKDYISCECNCNNDGEYGCPGNWESKKYVSLYYRPDTKYNSEEISKLILEEAKEKLKAIKIYEKYKKSYDCEKWERLEKK